MPCAAPLHCARVPATPCDCGRVEVAGPLFSPSFPRRAAVLRPSFSLATDKHEALRSPLLPLALQTALLLNNFGASIKDVCTKEEKGGREIPQLYGRSGRYTDFAYRGGGGFKSKQFLDVMHGSPLSCGNL